MSDEAERKKMERATRRRDATRKNKNFKVEL